MKIKSGFGKVVKKAGLCPTKGLTALLVSCSLSASAFAATGDTLAISFGAKTATKATNTYSGEQWNCRVSSPNTDAAFSVAAANLVLTSGTVSPYGISTTAWGIGGTGAMIAPTLLSNVTTGTVGNLTAIFPVDAISGNGATTSGNGGCIQQGSSDNNGANSTLTVTGLTAGNNYSLSVFVARSNIWATSAEQTFTLSSGASNVTTKLDAYYRTTGITPSLTAGGNGFKCYAKGNWTCATFSFVASASDIVLSSTGGSNIGAIKLIDTPTTTTDPEPEPEPDPVPDARLAYEFSGNNDPTLGSQAFNGEKASSTFSTREGTTDQYFTTVNGSVHPYANGGGITSGDFTVSFFANLGTAASSTTNSMLYLIGTKDKSFGLLTDGASGVKFITHAGSTITDVVSAKVAATWHMYTVTYSASTLAFYVDGKQVATKTSYTLPYPTEAKFQLGGCHGGIPTGMTRVSGIDISDFRIYGSALTAAQVATATKTICGVAADPRPGYAIVSGKMEDFASAVTTGWTLTDAEVDAGKLCLTNTSTATATVLSKEVAEGLSTVFTMELGFTAPSEALPTYAELIANGEKVVITPDNTGAMWVTDATSNALVKIDGVTCNTGVDVITTFNLRIAASRTPGSADVMFNVTLTDTTNANNTGTIMVKAANTAIGYGFSMLGFEGNGTVDNILLAQADEAIIPHSGNSAQDSENVLEFAKWQNEKGADVPYDPTAEELAAIQDAFMMDVEYGSDPTIEILNIATYKQNSQDFADITIRGTYLQGTTAMPVTMKNIKGLLTVYGSDVLNGTPTIFKVNITTENNGTIVIPVPGKKFMKAKVEFLPDVQFTTETTLNATAETAE